VRAQVLRRHSNRTAVVRRRRWVGLIVNHESAGVRPASLCAAHVVDPARAVVVGVHDRQARGRSGRGSASSALEVLARTRLSTTCSVNFRLASIRGATTVAAGFVVESVSELEAVAGAQLLLEVFEATTSLGSELQPLEGNVLSIPAGAKRVSRIVPGDTPARHFAGGPRYSPCVEHLAHPRTDGVISVAWLPSLGGVDVLAFSERSDSEVLASLAALEVSSDGDGGLDVVSEVLADRDALLESIAIPTGRLLGPWVLADLISVASRWNSGAHIDGTLLRPVNDEVDELTDAFLRSDD